MTSADTTPPVIEKMWRLLYNYQVRTGVTRNEYGNAWLIHPRTWTGLALVRHHYRPTPEHPNGTAFGMPILTSLDVPEDEVRMVFGVRHPHLADLPKSSFGNRAVLKGEVTS